MKAFFISDRSEPKTLARMNNVTQIFKKFGVLIDDSQLKRSSQDDAIHFEQAYKQNMLSLKNSDILVAEVTNLSSGIGFLISTALSQKKPVLTLFYKESNKKPSTMLKGSTSNRLMFFREYSKVEKDIETITKDFLNNIKKILDTKFILIIPSEIDRYLEWASDYKRMHKAQVVREAIEKYMEKDEEWKEYLASE